MKDCSNIQRSEESFHHLGICYHYFPSFSNEKLYRPVEDPEGMFQMAMPNNIIREMRPKTVIYLHFHHLEEMSIIILLNKTYKPFKQAANNLLQYIQINDQQDLRSQNMGTIQCIVCADKEVIMQETVS